MLSQVFQFRPGKVYPPTSVRFLVALMVAFHHSAPAKFFMQRRNILWVLALTEVARG
jgi:hypothetical protein